MTKQEAVRELRGYHTHSILSGERATELAKVFGIEAPMSSAKQLRQSHTAIVGPGDDEVCSMFVLVAAIATKVAGKAEFPFHGRGSNLSHQLGQIAEALA